MIHGLNKMPLPEVENVELQNGTKYIECSLGVQEIVKIDILFRAGRIVEDKPLASRATANLLRNDTQLKSAKVVEEILDFYGTSIKVASGMDYSYISFVTLNKFFEPVSDVVEEMIKLPKFSEKELNKFKKNSIAKLKIELSKNDVVAYREHTSLIFGESHPYGYNSTAEGIQKLELSDITQHYSNYYTSRNCMIFVTGKVTDSIRHSIHQKFGAIENKSLHQNKIKQPIRNAIGTYHFESKNKLQAALRIGCPLFPRNHQDNAGFYMLNTLLGGYFGSRLMKKIREEDGYTYGIYSSMDQMVDEGYFYVSCELAPENVDIVSQAIFDEMNLLKNDLVGRQELEMVKNYVMGSILNLLDGPFNIGSYYKMLYSNGLDKGFYDSFVDAVKSTDSRLLRDLAIKYFDENKMTQVIVQ